MDTKIEKFLPINDSCCQDYKIFDDAAWIAEMFNKFATDPFAHFFKAYFDGKLAGLCAVYHNTTKPQHFCKIMDFEVALDFRKKGVGRAMMNKIIEFSNQLGLNKIKLEVSTKNIGALNLYKSFDFEIEEIEKDFYGKDNDAFIMWRYNK